MLCALGLAGPVFALIEQPRLGWSSPGVFVPLIGGVALFAGFLLYESRASDPMLPLGLFRRRNFSAGNIETFSMYAGLAILFFFLVLFLQQIGGYTPLQSGLATLPVTIVMFVLSRRFGALADRYGPRFFMGAGPLVAAAGLLLFQTTGPTGRLRLGSLPPAAALLARAVDDGRAADRRGARRDGNPGGHRLGCQQRDRARGRAARHGRRRRRDLGLVRLAFTSHSGSTPLARAGRAAVAEGQAPAARQPDVHGLPPGQAHAMTGAAEEASLHSFHLGMMIAAVLVALGGVVGVAWIRNPRGASDVNAGECGGGQLVGSPDVPRGQPRSPASARRRAAASRPFSNQLNEKDAEPHGPASFDCRSLKVASPSGRRRASRR